MKQLAIVGAGLVGNLLALYLARAGYQVSVYERLPDPRITSLRADRSVNITVAVRGFCALDAVGIGDIVRQNAIPIYGRIIHDEKGDCTYQPYGANREANQAIRRRDLHRILLDAADVHPNVTFCFNATCTDLDLATNTLYFRQNDDGSMIDVQADRIFAADGAFSTVRYILQRQKRFDYVQQFLSHGYREITLSANQDGSPPFDRNAFHIWPRANIVLYGFANLDGTFTLSLVMPHEGNVSNETINDPQTLRQLFTCQFPDVLPLLEPILAEAFQNPFESMVTIKCYPWVYQNRIALIGDACHAILPFYGQGANAGFEDCMVLMNALDTHNGNWGAALHHYQTMRKTDTDTIANLCSEHFVEIMDHVSEPDFQRRKEIERILTTHMPERTSLYHNISFTNMRYTQAVQMETQHRQLVDHLMTIEDIDTKLRIPEAVQAMMASVNGFSAE
ncbi:MAG: NAD(P)/FAD-dependent oxidoreductase [Chloroflexota bacterium]